MPRLAELLRVAWFREAKVKSEESPPEALKHLKGY
jgi:hypothetical protein